MSKESSLLFPVIKQATCHLFVNQYLVHAYLIILNVVRWGWMWMHGEEQKNWCPFFDGLGVPLAAGFVGHWVMNTGQTNFSTSDLRKSC